MQVEVMQHVLLLVLQGKEKLSGIVLWLTCYQSLLMQGHVSSGGACALRCQQVGIVRIVQLLGVFQVHLEDIALLAIVPP